MKKQEIVVANKITLKGERKDSFRGLYKIMNIDIPNRKSKGIYFK